MSKIIRFKDWDCTVLKSTYRQNGAIALQLVAANTDHNKSEDTFAGEAIATATVCLPEQPLSEGETLIAGSSANEGMLEALVNAGIVEDLGVTVPYGYLIANLVKVLL